MLNPENSPTPNQDDIAALAHQLWQERGAPEGTPEEDWYQAEAQLTEQR